MDQLLLALRAAAEPTRLRLLALAARGSFCVTDFTEILGQSQPRLSRHLKLLCEAGLLERVREGANVWFALPHADHAGGIGRLARDILARAPAEDDNLLNDRRQAARVIAERARAASELFQRDGVHWDEMQALNLPAEAVEAALGQLLPGNALGRVLDIGSGTGRLLEFLAPRIASGLGVDASRTMLALARTRLAQAGIAHCTVRQADMYQLPLADRSFDLVLMHMVLHHAEDPAAALAEAARVLRPGGTLVVADLLHHDRTDITAPLAHRWPGFADHAMQALLTGAGFAFTEGQLVPGALTMRLWAATSPVSAARPAAFAGSNA